MNLLWTFYEADLKSSKVGYHQNIHATIAHVGAS